MMQLIMQLVRQPLKRWFWSIFRGSDEKIDPMTTGSEVCVVDVAEAGPHHNSAMRILRLEDRSEVLAKILTKIEDDAERREGVTLPEKRAADPAAHEDETDDSEELYRGLLHWLLFTGSCSLAGAAPHSI